MSVLVDIHTHIIPGIDDGADSMADALHMADIAAESGVQELIATPHSYELLKETTSPADKISELVRSLQEEINKENIPLRLYSGMEILVDSDTLRLLKEGKLLTLNSSRYPLLEFEFSSDREFITDTLSSIRNMGYVPVLAHPERYDAVQEDPNMVYELVENGIIMQINKTSLLGGFGKHIWQISNELVAHGLAGVVASDAHSPYSRTTSMLKIQSYLSHEFSPELCARLISENPKRILNDEEIIQGEIFQIHW